MRIYLSPITELTALYTNLSEIWLFDPAKRRLMRARGIDEATVRGDRGDLALLRAYLSVLPEKGGERRRAEAELAVLSLSLTDADALWTAAAERLDSCIGFCGPHISLCLNSVTPRNPDIGFCRNPIRVWGVILRNF